MAGLREGRRRCDESAVDSVRGGVDTVYVDHEGALRARLLDCALRMVAEDGVPALSLRAIARRAEVSHGAPLRHFPSRAALLSAVAAEGYRLAEQRRAHAIDACGRTGSAAERLHAAARAYVEFALDHPGLYELMSRPDLLVPSDPLLRRASRPFYESGVALVAARQADEGWQAELDSRLLAATLWAALHGFAQLWLMGAVTRASHATSLPDALEVALRALDLAPPR
jgi:AcrR family transcriptional regulator